MSRPGPDGEGYVDPVVEVNFDFQREDLYLVMMVKWGGSFASNFLVARSAEHAIEIALTTIQPDDKNLTVAAVPWNKLREERHQLGRKWREKLSRN